MSLLGILLTAVALWCLWQIVRAIFTADQRPGCLYRLSAEVGRICSHVGDEACFIKPLSHGHGFLYGKTQTGARGLLQRRRYKRRIRTTAGGLVLTLGDLERLRLQQFQQRHSRGFIGGAEILTLIFAYLKTHRGRVFLTTKIRKGIPIFFRHKGAYLSLPLDDQSHGDTLHASSGQTPSHLGPQ